MLYKLDHNTEEATKNISCAKGEGGVDSSRNFAQDARISMIRKGQIGLKL